MGASRIELPRRTAGESGATADQFAEIYSLLAKVGLDDVAESSLENIGSKQAEWLLERLRQVWNGDIEFNRYIGQPVTKSSRPRVSGLGLFTLTVSVLLIVILLGASLY